MCKCRSHGTFPLFGLQSSHLNICYYHQDLHRSRPPTHRGIALAPTAGYPEGNFGGNQLLDGSISLSPLYPSQTNDLHVSIAAGLHQSFLWLRPAQAESTIFWVPTGMLSLEPFTEDQGRSAVQPPGGSRQLASLRLADGPNGEPKGRCPERAGAEARQQARAAFHNRDDDVSTGLSTVWTWATVVIHVGRLPESIGGPATPFHIRPGRIAGPHPLPSRQFQAVFDSLFKVLFIFPSRYLFAIGLSPVFSRLRSRSLTELTRQIAPPTKNGHAPPPIESRKSSQSVNPYYVWT
ncbi:hypothetical protein PIB30_097471, partial [Stylosanthes scabra]|nr:hypothetical protein [Stylosanthes scabra]